VALLDRDAEFTGWQFQRNALASAVVTQDKLVENFLDSAEFRLKFNTPSDAEFIRLLYRLVLLREAAQSEVDGWTNVLRAPGNTRVVVARSFLNSPEFRNGTGSRLTTFLLYATLLQRDPSGVERATTVGEVGTQEQIRTAVEGIVDSSELALVFQ
jgi:hypothetical protein